MMATAARMNLSWNTFKDNNNNSSKSNSDKISTSAPGNILATVVVASPSTAAADVRSSDHVPIEPVRVDPLAPLPPPPNRPSHTPLNEVPTSTTKKIELSDLDEPGDNSPDASNNNVIPEDGMELDVQSAPNQSTSLPTIDMEVFHQILELDEDGTYEFSWGMAWAYFSQATATFEEMNQALAKKDLAKLSSLGHYLKGSSAALGVSKVQASCEQIQHYGEQRDEGLGIDLTAEEATDKIKRLLVVVQEDYKVAERWLRDWFDSRRTET